MESLYQFMRRAMTPKLPIMILLAVASVASLLYVFLRGHSESPLAVPAYLLSGYTLAAFVWQAPGWTRGIRAAVYANEHSNRYMTDLPFRAVVSLYASLFVNIAFSLLKLGSAILYTSLWFGAVAVYYMILSVLRFRLLRHLRAGQGDLRRAWRQYRFCGYILFALNIVLVAMTLQMIHDGRGMQYPGLLIYAVAAYSFYALTMAIISVVRCRKLNSPVLSAAKTISLSAAFVSLFTLQSAMFASFGDGGPMQRRMNAWVGGAVCTAIFGIALFMVIMASRKLSHIRVDQR